MSKTILVVDDSVTVRQQVCNALTEAGFATMEAKDGQEGKERIEAGGMSMVICDVNMPRMNGIEMLEACKAAGSSQGLPIVMLTTEAQPELIGRAKAAGASGWIIKPFKADLLVAAVKKLAA